VYRNEWSGVKGIIEGDIKACFDEVDHHIVLALLRKKTADERFLGLIWKALRAGYMWKAIRRALTTLRACGIIT
jgi:retron-type reverse transcriptase